MNVPDDRVAETRCVLGFRLTMKGAGCAIPHLARELPRAAVTEFDDPLGRPLDAGISVNTLSSQIGSTEYTQNERSSNDGKSAPSAACGIRNSIAG
jgi:hypothetical protein